MAVTLSLAGGTPLQLPNDLIWTDELDWSPIAQSKKWSIDGALVIDRFKRMAGRPITLIGNEKRSWVLRSVLQALQAWAALENDPIFELNVRGAIFQVIFDLGEDGKNAVRGEPVFAYEEMDPNDPYCSVELRFLEM
ncbi:hypothetical protein GNX71_29015 [Variovorax sp. RKNM96]|uniref:hypothetical protein n=1 Tax=Variovorax sp. RKNM96 TaxID=2681552 RepID=UPI0019814464|nr:hypothetical protein [Variovorax sp. RKNM96]QSI33391.1 hypothetical protein GNX71_29015 [Variovorax sp. RKNM96]